MNIQKKFNFTHNTEGSVLIFAAISIVALTMAAGVGVDTYVAQSRDAALTQIVDLTCDRITNADIAIFPTVASVNGMAQTYADNLKVGTAASEAAVNISSTTSLNAMSAPVTVEASAVFDPTFTAVMGNKSISLKKNASCQRSTLTSNCSSISCTNSTSKSNVILINLDITTDKILNISNLLQFASTDKLGNSQRAFVYTILDPTQSNKIIERKIFSTDTIIKASSLPNSGSELKLYVQAMNKDGTVPVLWNGSVLPPLVVPVVNPPSPSPIPPPLPSNTLPPRALKCPVGNELPNMDQEVVYYRHWYGLLGSVIDPSSVKLTPAPKAVIQGSTSEFVLKGDFGSLTVPITSNFSVSSSSPFGIEFGDYDTIEKQYIKDMVNGINSTGRGMISEGYRLDTVINFETAMWQAPDGSCVRTDSPIVIDLTGKGKIETTGVSTAKMAVRAKLGKTISFDMNGSGKPQKIEWLTASGQGFLIDNRDGKAAVDMSGKRLFGNNETHANGYSKLATMFKTDKDGMITGDNLKGLAVWIDNGDGVVQSQEIKSLSELGITAIGTRIGDVKDDKGDMLMRSYVIRDGKRVMSEDVWLGTEP